VQGVSPSRAILRFSDFEVDLRAGELRKQGVRVKLQEQPFQILQALLEHPGEVVTREELQRQIWAADTFVDFDHGLYNAIKRLREALGDTADTSRFVQTVPKRGYRFIGAVNGHGAENAPVQAPPAELLELAPPTRVEPATKVPVKRRWPKILAVALAVSAALAVLLTSAPGGIASNLRRWFSSGKSVPPIHSVAVLPLQNLSGDPAQEYFADGMTDELITELSGISALKVISRTSVMRYKKSDKSLPEIARELRVDGIVEGSVVRNGNEVRVTAQLIYAPEDKNVWARSYERQIQDSLTLQSEVASAIAGAVRAQIAADEQARLHAARPANPKALEAYLQGSYHYYRYGYGFGIEEADKALEYFRQAIAEDPSFALAYASMANVYSQEGILVPQAQTAALIKAAAEKALALDPNLADAHRTLGDVKSSYDWNWQGAEREYRRAVELDPNNALAHEYLGGHLVSMGRTKEGLDEQQRAQELDPAGWHMEGALYLARQYDEAISLFTGHLNIDPTDGTAHYWLSECYAQKGMYKEAFQHLRTTLALFGLHDIAEAMDRGYAARGYKGAMLELVKGTEQLYARHQFTSQWIARFYMRLGDQERALKWLQQDYKQREDDGLVGLNADPVWDPLRSDPRFKDLVRRVGLPEIDVVALNRH
jgi:TolB-like protein/DNA-binding winged helix-turn-helix (wHTH) protein